MTAPAPDDGSPPGLPTPSPGRRALSVLLHLAGLALQQTYLRIQELRADAFSAALTHPSWMMGYLLGIREPGAVETRSLRERIFSTHPHYQDRLDALDPTGELRDSR